MPKSRRPLTAEELKELQERLLKRKDELWEEVRESLLHQLGEEYQDVIRTVGDDVDLAQAGVNEELILSALQSRKMMLEGIAQALWRMDKGEYGKCLDCGRWIRFQRLRARPWSSYCTDCKNKREKQGLEA